MLSGSGTLYGSGVSIGWVLTSSSLRSAASAIIRMARTRSASLCAMPSSLWLALLANADPLPRPAITAAVDPLPVPAIGAASGMSGTPVAASAAAGISLGRAARSPDASPTVACRGSPHPLQNRASDMFSRPHAVQRTSLRPVEPPPYLIISTLSAHP